MADLCKITHAAMRSLVKSYGCYDAVAEMLNTSKGTISKKMSGQLDWTGTDIIALQDASGRWPVTRAWARQADDLSQPGTKCLIAQGGVIAKECGEALAAILSATQSSSADERARAVVEINEAIVSLKSAREKLKQPVGFRKPTGEGV